MKGNVKVIRNFFKVATIAIVFLLAITMKAYAADSNITIDNFNEMFNNLPTIEDDGNQQSNQTSEAEAEAKAKAEAEAKAKEEAAKKNAASTSTKSASKDEMPATGSNAEIIFGVGVVVLASVVAYVYKKQSIKLK